MVTESYNQPALTLSDLFPQPEGAKLTFWKTHTSQGPFSEGSMFSECSQKPKGSTPTESTHVPKAVFICKSHLLPSIDKTMRPTQHKKPSSLSFSLSEQKAHRHTQFNMTFATGINPRQLFQAMPSQPLYNCVWLLTRLGWVGPNLHLSKVEVRKAASFGEGGSHSHLCPHL